MCNATITNIGRKKKTKVLNWIKMTIGPAEDQKPNLTIKLLCQKPAKQRYRHGSILSQVTLLQFSTEIIVEKWQNIWADKENKSLFVRSGVSPTFRTSCTDSGFRNVHTAHIGSPKCVWRIWKPQDAELETHRTSGGESQDPGNHYRQYDTRGLCPEMDILKRMAYSHISASKQNKYFLMCSVT